MNHKEIVGKITHDLMQTCHKSMAKHIPKNVNQKQFIDILISSGGSFLTTIIQNLQTLTDNAIDVESTMERIKLTSILFLTKDDPKIKQ